MKRLSQEYRYRRLASWFNRRASRLAQARVNHTIVSGKEKPFSIWAAA